MNQVNKVPLLGVWSWHSEKLGWLKCRNSVKSRGHYGRPWAKSTSREQKENGAGGQRHKRWAEPLQPLIPRGVTLISKFSVSKPHFPKDLWNVLCLDSMWVSVAYNKPPFFFFLTDTSLRCLFFTPIHFSWTLTYYTALLARTQL